MRAISFPKRVAKPTSPKTAVQPNSRWSLASFSQRVEASTRCAGGQVVPVVGFEVRSEFASMTHEVYIDGLRG